MCLNSILHIPISVHCHLPYHWILLRAWLHLLIFLLRYLCTLRILFSQLNNPSSISLSRIRCFNPLVMSMTFCWAYSRMLVSPLNWKTKNWTRYSTCMSPELSRRRESLLLDCLDNPLPNAAQDVDGLHDCNSTLLAHDHLVTCQDSKVFLFFCGVFFGNAAFQHEH